MKIRTGETHEIEEFQLYDEENQGEEILVVESEGKVVAYAQVTDENIFFLESEAKGGGRMLVEFLQEREGYLVAKSVEETAKGFWQKMDFEFMTADGFGGEDWDWEKG
jgi:hypothetical protein